MLLLLAGITISLLFGQNGAITRARETRVAGRYSQILDLEQLRAANNLINTKIPGEIEIEEDFVIRLKALGLLIDGEDTYDDETRILNIGGYKDIILSGAEKNILEEIIKLPTVEQYPEMKHMTLQIKTTAANEQVTIPISSMTDYQIDWGNNTITGTNLYTYPLAGTYEVKIINKTDTPTVEAKFGISTFYTNTNIVGLKYWGENNFTAINSLGGNLVGSIPLPSKNSFINVRNFNYLFAMSSNITEIPEGLFANALKLTNLLIHLPLVVV